MSQPLILTDEQQSNLFAYVEQLEVLLLELQPRWRNTRFVGAIETIMSEVGFIKTTVTAIKADTTAIRTKLGA